ncbi:MAG: hypothetical protein DRN12_02905 [Thermoplasmata archaeon]|nr:MAG: hypothetical protein DRN12_02905 [Thermoplasmata archaeon]
MKGGRKIGIGVFLILFCIAIQIDSHASDGDTIYVDAYNTDGPWDGSIEHPYRYIISSKQLIMLVMVILSMYMMEYTMRG